MSKDEAIMLALEAFGDIVSARSRGFGIAYVEGYATTTIKQLRQALAEPEQPIKTPDWRDVARLHQQAIDDRTMNFDVTRFATLLANDIQQINGREYIFDNYESYNKTQSVKKFIEQHNRQMGWDNYD